MSIVVGMTSARFKKECGLVDERSKSASNVDRNKYKGMLKRNMTGQKSQVSALEFMHTDKCMGL